MSDNERRIAEIRSRVDRWKSQIKNGATIENGKLVISLEFEDEGGLCEQWMNAVADCNSLLCILDGGKPI